MNRKKGISAIVATVLIILITVAAVTIIWAAIIPMINKNLQGSGECFDASAALSVISDYSCYNKTVTFSCSDPSYIAQATCTADTDCNNDGTASDSCVWAAQPVVKLQVGRTAGDFELVGISLIASYQGSSDSVELTSVPGANGEKVYTVQTASGLAGKGQLDLTGVDSASVAAVVKTGNSQKTCDASGSTAIGPCA